MVIFIIGPYARKWFPHPQPISDRADDDLISWILAPDIEDLHKELNRVRRANRQAVTMAFFPFLPDGQVSSEFTLAQIADWQASFSALPLTESLPCIFGLYAQLSQERSEEDPDRAIWLGKFDVAARKETTLSKEFINLGEMLSQHGQTGDYHAIQRSAMADALHSWLRDTGVMKSLQTLFSETSLKLTGVLLSDYGKGFVRHGAWANWIASRLEIYPGLASSMTLPQVPDVLYKPGVKTIIREAEQSGKKICWPPVVAALLLGLMLACTTWFEGQSLLQARQSLEAFNDVDALYLQQKRDAFNALVKEKESLSVCSDNLLLRVLGLSRCNKIRADISNIIRQYESSPILFSSGPVAMFSLNSAEIRNDSDESLKNLLPVVANNRQTTFMIVGHSDNTGSHELNMQLSERRARVVRDWLVKHAGVPPTNFLVKGAGDTVPIASNETEEGRKQNRRVDLIPLPANQHTNNE